MIDFTVGPGNPKFSYRYLLRNPGIVATASALFFGTGVLTVLLAPGPVSNPLSGVSLLVDVTIAIGVLTGVTSILAVVLAIGPNSRRRRGGMVGPLVLVALAVATLVSFTSLSLGWLPGWYYGPTGTLASGVDGCGGYPGSPFPLDFPDGFPPGATVHLRWYSETGAPISFSFDQSTPGYSQSTWPSAPTLKYEANASSGNFSIEGSGGAVWIGAQNLTECSARDSAILSWSYTLGL